MLKKILIALFSSIFSVILTGIITLGILDLTRYSHGDCGWIAVWLCGAFLPILFFLPFIIADRRQKKTIDDFMLFCVYSGCTVFIIISVILLILVPQICS
ncbi:hypothetical protein [Chryseobacterium gallinarum]|uniref:hypothetical protein n=1 Tax=Chryseobacterium gallinarum TaxID=1324352 RepID=UPI000B00C934|nr:hypothetical protein [Chryseobacterium gallinarum]